METFGRLDIMVYAAGTTKRVPTLEMSEEDWERIMDTNLTGMFRSCQVFGGEMVAPRIGPHHRASARCRRSSACSKSRPTSRASRRSPG